MVWNLNRNVLCCASNFLERASIHFPHNLGRLHEPHLTPRSHYGAFKLSRRFPLYTHHSFYKQLKLGCDFEIAGCCFRISTFALFSDVSWHLLYVYSWRCRDLDSNHLLLSVFDVFLDCAVFWCDIRVWEVLPKGYGRFLLRFLYKKNNFPFLCIYHNQSFIFQNNILH